MRLLYSGVVQFYKNKKEGNLDLSFAYLPFFLPAYFSSPAMVISTPAIYFIFNILLLPINIFCLYCATFSPKLCAKCILNGKKATQHFHIPHKERKLHVLCFMVSYCFLNSVI